MKSNKFIGIVESVNDPSQLNRVRVRVFSLHTENKELLPTDKLPWAIVQMPVTSASNSGIGTHHQLLNGSHVFVEFLDGDDYQIPIVVGTLVGVPTEKANTTIGFNDETGTYPLEQFLNKSDLPQRAKNDNVELESNETTVFSGIKDTYDFPPDPYSAQYPNNYIINTPSGNYFELDSTVGAERIKLSHRTGTYTQYNPNGDLVENIEGTYYRVSKENERVYIKGYNTITVDGFQQVLIKGDVELVVEGNCNLKVAGNCAQNVTGDYVIGAQGNLYLHSEQKIIVSGQQIHLNSDGFPLPADLPRLDVTAYDAAVSQQDEPSEDEGLNSDEVQILKDRSGNTDTGEIISTDNSLPDSTNSDNIELQDPQCSLIDDPWSYDTVLSSRFTVGSLTTHTTYPHTLKAQAGLTEKQLLCNGHTLVRKILEPFVFKYGANKLRITSGFRPGNGSSHHHLMAAVDIQMRGWTKQDYLNAMAWMRDNLEYTQIILEKGNSYWIHASYVTGDIRKEILTRTSPGVYKSGIVNFS